MITIRNKQTGETFNIHNALKSEATKDSFINNTPITARTLSNWHALYDYKLVIGTTAKGDKAIFQFSLKHYLEVIL